MRARPLTLVVLAVGAASLLTACASSTAHGNGSTAHGSSSSIGPTGSATADDVAFARAMISHHQQAVQMSDLARSHASSPAVLALARQIKGAQDPEIELMRQWLSDWGAPPLTADEHEDHDTGEGASAGMMSDADLSALDAAAGSDFDQMWLRMMIAHHRGAIHMADQILAVTQHPAVGELAQAVLDGQAAEIDAMQGLLDQGTGASPESGSSHTQGWQHVHNLALDGDRLLLGTHEGLWEQLPGQDPTLLSAEIFDVMGLTRDGSRWLASGHPGPGMDAPADLGLLESVDDGRSWRPVSLSGEVDFHRLAAAGTVVVGISAHDGALLRSTDDGRSWSDLGTPSLLDIALDPDSGMTVLGTTQAGPVRSTDGGYTFVPVVDAPALALLAWTAGSLVGVSPDGKVFRSADSGESWEPAGSVRGQPEAVAASGTFVTVLVDDTLFESADGGVTFAARA